MKNIVYANVTDLANNTHIIESYNNEIWMIFIIILILFIFKIKSLLVQYIICSIILFVYSPIYGITYANLIFFLYNFMLFKNMKNFYTKFILFFNILICSIIILLKILNIDYNTYITVPIINLFSLLSNLYFLFYFIQ